MKNFINIFIKTVGILLLSAVIILSAGFFAIRLGLTNVAGEEDINSPAYNIISKIIISLPESPSVYGPNEHINWCKIMAVAKVSPFNARAIFEAYKSTKSQILLDRMILAVKLRVAHDSVLLKDLDDCGDSDQKFNQEGLETFFAQENSTKSMYSWQNEEPWQVIKEAIIKDKDKIDKAAAEFNIQPRLLVSVAIVEQLRLYYTQREFYEKFFKPLKILANANKMAWGVMSIKEKMAIETEQNLLKDSSDFFPGEEYMNLLGSPSNEERYARLTNEKDHYYSYLYGAAIIAEFQAQWAKYSYDLKYRPEIIATLFNIGFSNSQPKENPVVGGSSLEIDGQKYLFGALAYEFYYSGELVEEFPFK